MKNTGPRSFDADFETLIRGLKRGSASKITKMGNVPFGGAGEKKKRLSADELTSYGRALLQDHGSALPDFADESWLALLRLKLIRQRRDSSFRPHQRAL